MFKQNLEKINYPKVEKNILEFWEKNKIFEKSISSRDEKNLHHQAATATADGSDRATPRGRPCATDAVATHAQWLHETPRERVDREASAHERE